MLKDFHASLHGSTQGLVTPRRGWDKGELASVHFRLLPQIPQLGGAAPPCDATAATVLLSDGATHMALFLDATLDRTAVGANGRPVLAPGQGPEAADA